MSPGAASAGHSDDCASLREALTKRFGGVNGSDGTVGTSGGQEEWPGLVLIDGGKGQLNAVLPPPPSYQMDTPRPSPRTNRTRRVPHPVLIGHAASLSQVLDAMPAGAC